MWPWQSIWVAEETGSCFAFVSTCSKEQRQKMVLE